MSKTPTRNVALTTELESFIRSQVASGRYNNSSEVVRSALRTMIDQDAKRLRAEQRHGG